MILQVSSIGGELPGPLQAVYHGTKAFVTSFTEAIREEVKGHNIKITALLPGVTDTDFFRKADMERSKLVAEGARARPTPPKWPATATKPCSPAKTRSSPAL
ncbi:hypothetical protein AUC43_19445 [Hymenobacter sedentarius]|uniref:Oxidoreductase n=1 Tax=Hymenobacter sedentarius TaxID=1411621 RepID=A0A0U4CUE5_9BACT|nr:SDR family NAD(P)-dependent oxidoreductase [Hymenobacter sedentarius]ALW87054.1 hypothetical protein AUC43_19445 [Hymenobacter sedentarius]